MTKVTYEDRATKLLTVIEIAVNSFKVMPPKGWDEQTIKQIVNIHLSWKNDILNPLPQYKNTVSLSILENDIFTYFQEAAGKTVDFFWTQINDEGLDYRRENKLVKILKRKKIKTEMEYDFIIDTIVPYQQEGLIDNHEVELLNKLLLEYEQKN